jgi:FAD/FMN-containing dehydrogenase
LGQLLLRLQRVRVAHGGKCTFNQTKVLSKSQVERAFGDKWDRFKQARETADPNQRFLSAYFKTLMYGTA